MLYICKLMIVLNVLVGSHVMMSIQNYLLFMIRKEINHMSYINAGEGMGLHVMQCVVA